MPEFARFSPEGGASTGEVVLSLDEYQAIRLMDCEGCTHEQCAAMMQVSRTTVTEIYASARAKLAEALVHGRTLAVGGGNVRLCEHASACEGGACGRCAPEGGQAPHDDEGRA